MRRCLFSVLCGLSLQLFSMDTNYLVAIRHGHGEHLINRVFSSLTEKEGGVDHHLTEQGRAEVAKTAEELFKQGFTKDTVKLVLVSPLNRTKETAQILVEHKVCSPEALQIEEQIREHKMYNLEGIVRESIPGIDDCTSWTEEICFLEQKGAEKFQDLLGRVHAVFNSLPAVQGHIILVTHGAVVSALSIFHGNRSPVKTAEARIFPFPKK